VIQEFRQPLYCGTERIACGNSRHCEAAECTALVGTTLSGDKVDVCADTNRCNNAGVNQSCLVRAASRSYRAADAAPVLVDTCTIPAGWLEVDSSECGLPGGPTQPPSNNVATGDAAAPKDCKGLDEVSCVDGCFPFVGVPFPDGTTAQFIECGSEGCPASRTICAENAGGDLVRFNGCVGPSYTEVDDSRCRNDAGSGP
jgi:hypothetical protein